MRFVDGEPVIMLGECGEVPIKRLSEFTYTPPAPLHTATQPTGSLIKAALDAYVIKRLAAMEQATNYLERREIEEPIESQSEFVEVFRRTVKAEAREDIETASKFFREHPDFYDAHRASVSIPVGGPEVSYYERDPANLAAIETEVKRLRDADETLTYSDAVTKVSELSPGLFGK